MIEYLLGLYFGGIVTSWAMLWIRINHDHMVFADYKTYQKHFLVAITSIAWPVFVLYVIRYYITGKS